MRFKLICAFLLFCTAVKAQTTDVVITPSHFQAADDALTASGAGVQMKENITTMIKQASGNVPEDKRGKFMAVMEKFMSKYLDWDIFKDQMANLYAQAFTEKELKELTAFYRSPLGKKLNEKQPLIFQKSADMGKQAVAIHQDELKQMLDEALKP